MLITVATLLAGLVGAGIVVIGLREILWPRSAAGFGIPGSPVDDPVWRAWLQVKAVRDIAAGVFTFVLIVGAAPHLLGWFMLAAAGIPAGDALIVLRSGGPKAVAYGVHASTSAVMLVSSLLFFVA